MPIRRKFPPPANYATEASLTTEIAWAVCRRVYMTTPDMAAVGQAGCVCQHNGRNIACASMTEAATDVVQTVERYYKEKGQ